MLDSAVSVSPIAWPTVATTMPKTTKDRLMPSASAIGPR